MKKNENRTNEFNECRKVPFQLSMAMGYTHFDTSSINVEKILSSMDQNMYQAKRKNYQQERNNRRR